MPMILPDHGRKEFFGEKEWCQQISLQSNAIIAICTLGHGAAARQTSIVD